MKKLDHKHVWHYIDHWAVDSDDGGTDWIASFICDCGLLKKVEVEDE